LIRARVFSRLDLDLDAELLTERVRAARARRQQLLPGENDFRLLYGESDGLPGLVADWFGSHCAVRVYAAGMENRLESIVDVLRRVLGAESIYAKNDFRLRDVEGLPRCERSLLGAVPDRIDISENGVGFTISVALGQKTGFYFDQRNARRRVRELAAGRRVLDLFCYSAGFAVNAALGGAREVIAVDASEPACELARRSVQLNGVSGLVSVQCADAFDLLRDLNSRSEKFDMIILDPPPFVKQPGDLKRGFAAYRDVNYQAMRLLAPDGLLVTCSCSYHLSWSDLLDAIRQAAQGCGRELTIRERITQSPDHPILLTAPETEYLRCYVLQLT
jgi:23S rRNA (cytosine1962-C5)-methyltransferase